MAMEVVNTWYEKFGGTDLKKIQETIKKSVSNWQFDNVSFIVFAHEYSVNPADKKFFSFIDLYFRVGGAFQLNLPAPTFVKLKTMLNDPEIKGTNLNAKEIVPGTIFHSMPVPVTLTADQLKVRGGFVAGGAANYNLGIKALDLASTDLISGVGFDLDRGLQAPAGTQVDVASQMKAAYKVLLPYWGDSDLTKFGFTYR